MTHREHFLKKHGLPTSKSYSLHDISSVSHIPLSTLQQVYNRGIGAYKTNYSSVREKGTFRKGTNAPPSMKLSKEQWALSRVYSFADGSKKHDTDLRA
jgi:hypothetical protein